MTSATASPGIVTVGDELTIQVAAETSTRVAAALEAAPATLLLDLSAVEELDTAGLQVLLWAGREAAARGVSVELTVSEAVASVLSLAGVELATVGGSVR